MESYLVVVAIVFVCFMIGSRNAKKSYEEKIRKMLDEAYGQRTKRKYSHEDMGRIRYKSESREKSDNIIDDITWNDLSMDEIFKLVNNTYSSVGEEYLYDMMRTLNFNEKELNEFNEITEYFKEHDKEGKRLQKLFASIGRTKSISFYEFVHKLCELPVKNNILHIACALLGVLTIGMFFINAAIAVAMMCVIFTFNVYTYYREKAKVGPFFVCCKYLILLITVSEKIGKENIEVLKPYNDKMSELSKKLSVLSKNMFLISDGNMNDSILGIVMDYVRMLFHVDLIKFNIIVKEAYKNIDLIEELFDCVGRVESFVAVGSFKKMLENEYGFYAKPTILKNEKTSISFEEIYHPLIINAVKNSMKPEKAVLLTGSNASGKSTFLKTVAINGILSQTIGVACAKNFSMKESFVFSSMALKDDLENKESYYMVEIKSLKRIVDKILEGKNVLCFVDEVLRGTNTAERIAASSVILEKMCKDNTIVFAATHDIELTTLLCENFTNYHFEEDVKDDDVLFNYMLKEGYAKTRNAIKLLKVMGYDGEIVDKAKDRAENFLENHIWA